MEDDQVFSTFGFEEDYYIDAEARADARCARKERVHGESNVSLDDVRSILKPSSFSKLPQDLDNGTIQEGYRVPTNPANTGCNPLLLDSIGYPVRGQEVAFFDKLFSHQLRSLVSSTQSIFCTSLTSSPILNHSYKKKFPT